MSSRPNIPGPQIGINYPGYTSNYGFSLTGPTEQDQNIVAIDYLLGTAVPIISQRVQALNTTVVQSLTLSLTTTQMVQVSIYASAAGTASSGHEVVMTLNYTCELGAETIVVTLPLDTRTIVMETYPLLCIGGTTITLSTAYAGGATNDPYNIDARLVEMP